jgi:hypothetical protein
MLLLLQYSEAQPQTEPYWALVAYHLPTTAVVKSGASMDRRYVFWVTGYKAFGGYTE